MKGTEETRHLNAQENYLLSRNRRERLCAPAIAAVADCIALSPRVVAYLDKIPEFSPAPLYAY